MDVATARTIENAIQLLSERAMEIRSEHFVHGKWSAREWHEEFIFTMMTVIRLRAVADGLPVMPYVENYYNARNTYERIRPGRPARVAPTTGAHDGD